MLASDSNIFLSNPIRLSTLPRSSCAFGFDTEITQGHHHPTLRRRIPHQLGSTSAGHHITKLGPLMLKGPQIGPITGYLFSQHHCKDNFTLGNSIICYLSWLGQLRFNSQITWILVRIIPPHTLIPYSNLRIYFTRFLSDADINTRLQQRAAADRARASTPDDVFLLNNRTELGLSDVWTKGRNRISKDGITYAVAGYHDHHQSDDAYMTRFISKLRPNGVYHPGAWSLTDVYPMGGPLMDIVVACLLYTSPSPRD